MVGGGGKKGIATGDRSNGTYRAACILLIPLDCNVQKCKMFSILATN